MGLITRSLTPELLEPGLKVVFGLIRDKWEEEYSQMFDMETSQRAWEEYKGLGGTGDIPVKAEGAPIVYDTILNGFKTILTNITYASGLRVTQEAIEDNLYNDIMKLGEALGKSVINTVEGLGAAIYSRAFNSSYTFGDSKELCATDHPLEGGGTFSNEPSAAVNLSESSLEDALTSIENYVDARGKKIKVKATKLIVAPANYYEAAKLLGSDNEPESNYNAINPAKGLMPYVVSHYITDPKQWFIRTDQPGLVCQKRVWPADLVRDNDFDSGDMKMKTRFRLAFGAYDPRAIFGSPGV